MMTTRPGAAAIPSLLLLCLAGAVAAAVDWDLAVSLNGGLNLYDRNGTLLKQILLLGLNETKALTYDYKREQFILGVKKRDGAEDSQNPKYAIYSLRLNAETEGLKPIIENLPKNIYGIAVDPISDVLYWTDRVNRKILYRSLKNETDKGVLFYFEHEVPHDIAVDPCGRRLYWSNSEFKKATIESSTLDGKDRKVLVQEKYLPKGISVDHSTKKLYWVEPGDGIFGFVYSINLDGTQETQVREVKNQDPFSLAIEHDRIYWSDISNHAVWTLDKKNTKASLSKIEMKNYQRPFGIVTKSMGFGGEIGDCKYQDKSDDDVQVVDEKNKMQQNIPETHPATTACKCANGECLGDKCYCTPGFYGLTCDKHLCDTYCLNDAQCTLDENIPVCKCQENTTGLRCESINAPQSAPLRRLEENATEILCLNATQSIETQENVTLLRLQDPWFLALLSIVATETLIIVLLIVLTKRKRRTRVKKRYIYNQKNKPSLSATPQPASMAQCEITIENCCNMNLCETPCFDPPTKPSSTPSSPKKPEKDEKKTLLMNMENNADDLY